MSGLGKWPRLLMPSKIAEPIVDAGSDEVRDVSLVEGGSESLPGVSQSQPYHQTPSCHMSPKVQFCPVPLTKRMPERVGQVNRLGSQ